jgi:hypothetical protein
MYLEPPAFLDSFVPVFPQSCNNPGFAFENWQRESEIRIAKVRLTELGLQNRLLEFGIVWIPVAVMHGLDDF